MKTANILYIYYKIVQEVQKNNSKAGARTPKTTAKQANSLLIQCDIRTPLQQLRQIHEPLAYYNNGNKQSVHK